MNTTRRIARWLGLGVLAVLGAGTLSALVACGPRPVYAEGLTGVNDVRAVLVVENNNFYDATIYLVLHNRRMERLGDVSGTSTRAILIRDRHSIDGHLTVAVQLVGNAGDVTTDGTYVARGSHPVLTITPYLKATVLTGYP